MVSLLDAPSSQAPQVSWRVRTGDTTPTAATGPSLSWDGRDELVLAFLSCHIGNRNAFPGKHVGCSRI